MWLQRSWVQIPSLTPQFLGRNCLRTRQACPISPLNLANYSEFGLIVGAIALANGWLSGDWLVIVALALTLTFIIAAPLNARSRDVLARVKPALTRFESPVLLEDDQPIDPGDARIVIIGMSRMGTGVYDTLRQQYGDVLVAVDADPDVVAHHVEQGRNVLLADVTDEEHWARAKPGRIAVRVVAIDDPEHSLGVARRLELRANRHARNFALAHGAQEAEMLRAAGIDVVWDMDVEAGTAYGALVIHDLGDSLDHLPDPGVTGGQ